MVQCISTDQSHNICTKCYVMNKQQKIQLNITDIYLAQSLPTQFPPQLWMCIVQDAPHSLTAFLICWLSTYSLLRPHGLLVLQSSAQNYVLYVINYHHTTTNPPPPWWISWHKWQTSIGENRYIIIVYRGISTYYPRKSYLSEIITFLSIVLHELAKTSNLVEKEKDVRGVCVMAHVFIGHYSWYDCLNRTES